MRPHLQFENHHKIDKIEKVIIVRQFLEKQEVKVVLVAKDAIGEREREREMTNRE
jgi:hypothetical protein